MIPLSIVLILSRCSIDDRSTQNKKVNVVRRSIDDMLSLSRQNSKSIICTIFVSNEEKCQLSSERHLEDIYKKKERRKIDYISTINLRFTYILIVYIHKSR